MSRVRWFCSVCGALTPRPPDDGRYARCGAHSTLPRERDLIPPDQLSELPTLAAEVDARLAVGVESRAMSAAHPPRDDVSPADGTEPC